MKRFSIVLAACLALAACAAREPMPSNVNFNSVNSTTSPYDSNE